MCAAMNAEKMDFVRRLLKLIAEHDQCEELYWTEELSFHILCNDVFWWGTSDAEEVTENDLSDLEQALKDGGFVNGPLLYCARRREMRPQGAYYKHLEKGSWHLFDECGPSRCPCFSNPHPRPED